jgi:Ni/Co efflux regulator RcnB
VSQKAADQTPKLRRLALMLLAAAPLLMAEVAHADPDRRGRGGDRGQRAERMERYERRERPRFEERRFEGRRFDERRYERRYEDRDRGERYERGYRSYGRGDRDLRRGGVLPPQARGARIDDYERYRLRQPPRGYAWYRVGDDYMLAGVANGVIFDIID